jgi:hypothetical protein
MGIHKLSLVVGNQDSVIEQAVALVQFRLSQGGFETPTISKPDSWRFIGLDLHLGRGYTTRLTPTEAGVRVEVFSPAGWPAVAPETTPGEITPSDLADRVLALHRKAVG